MMSQSWQDPVSSIAATPRQSRLDSVDALAAHLDALGARDPRLAPAIARAGEVALRRSPSGFEGLARIVVGQQVSVASARAIWGRVEALGAVNAPAYLALGEDALRGAGLSRGKHATLRAIAEAEDAGRVVFAEIDALDAEAAIAALTALKGVGPWTAEIYLLFCTAHPDIFPAGDLALQKAVGHALGLEERPDAKALAGLARDWSPHRGAAALMFWRYYSMLKAGGGARAGQGGWDAL